MPSVSVSRDRLCRLIGKEYSNEEFEELLFDFGIELDEIYEEDNKTMYKLDIGANRYDLLCAEGISQAIQCYAIGMRYRNIVSGTRPLPLSKIRVVKKHTDERHAVACAVIRGVDMTGEAYDSFITYQDKLHGSIGRNRSIVAIGTHDLEKIASTTNTIIYQSVNLDSVLFKPLNASHCIRGSELEKHLRNDKQLSKYFSLLKDPRRSVIFMCNDKVISVPPIINSEDTKISHNTRDIFVEVTGTDINRVNTALKMLLYNFRGSKIEAVDIIDERKKSVVTTPFFNNHSFKLRTEEVRDRLKLRISREEIETLLERMEYRIGSGGRENECIVEVPDVRSDVMHECDILEDIAIAYGFNNIEKVYPDVCTIGSEDKINHFSEKIRQEIALFGFTEVLTLSLLSSFENFVDKTQEVILENPKSKEYEVVRTSLIPGLLKSVAANQHAKLPLRMFEVSDVVVLCDDSVAEVGARNKRMLCGMIAGHTSMLEEVHGPLSFLLEKCSLRALYRYEHGKTDYFLENQTAEVLVRDRKIGVMGVIHPRVCAMFKIPLAISAFEIDLGLLYEEFRERN